MNRSAYVYLSALKAAVGPNSFIFSGEKMELGPLKEGGIRELSSIKKLMA